MRDARDSHHVALRPGRAGRRGRCVRTQGPGAASTRRRHRTPGWSRRAAGWWTCASGPRSRAGSSRATALPAARTRAAAAASSAAAASTRRATAGLPSLATALPHGPRRCSSPAPKTATPELGRRFLNHSGPFPFLPSFTLRFNHTTHTKKRKRNPNSTQASFVTSFLHLMQGTQQHIPASLCQNLSQFVSYNSRRREKEHKFLSCFVLCFQDSSNQTKRRTTTEMLSLLPSMKA